ncbi:MAG TPA: DUF488 family protein [Mucilaginibacter sp.]|jgi:uncharacterized protein YeaO (DUF488 family)|nr:DUF488 family protein [Mucilaginibacter sp.]
MNTSPTINIKRIYEAYDEADGLRILVDHLWPRGIKKETAHIDRWFKEIAPSNELRKWYDHDPEKFQAFNKKYREELNQTHELDELINYIDHHPTITLLFAAKDADLSNAAVLRDVIVSHLSK